MNRKANLIIIILAVLALILLAVSHFGGLASETAHLFSFSAVLLIAAGGIYMGIHQISKDKATGIMIIFAWVVMLIAGVFGVIG